MTEINMLNFCAVRQERTSTRGVAVPTLARAQNVSALVRTLLSAATAATCLGLLCWPVAAAAADPIKVVVWDEQQPAQEKAYPNFLGNYIADYLKRQPGLQVHSVSINHPEKGLSEEVLDNCDVLIWWGHVRNRDISQADARPVVERLKRGELSLLALHSAHWATPFVLAMHERAAADALSQLPQADRKNAKIEFPGKIERRPPRRDAELTPAATVEKQDDGTTLIRITRPNCCFPAYKNHGKPSEIRRLLDHPIAAGIPHKFTLPHTEMYDEPFHVPQPDAVVFEEHWEDGQHFRSGMVWQVGQGRVFYFRPGHETHAVFTEELPLQIVENAVRWLGDGPVTPPRPPLEIGQPTSLFDGETLRGWTTQDGKPVTKGWTVEDGAIFRKDRGGNIVFEQELGDFELTFDWKIAKRGNSGVKYRVRKYGGRLLGCEYQLLGETGRNLSKGSCGSLYALYEPNDKKQLNSVGDWNTAKIVVHGPMIEHWMNGERIVEADLGSDEWRKRLARSKFSPHKDFARNPLGRIMLTDHGHQVWYRNLVVTLLPPQEIPPLAPEPTPNVVIFLTDDQGTLDANCYGSKDLHTPHMDRIAKEGVRFTQAYAHTVCCPARALLLTGRHPQRSGVNNWTQGDLRATQGLNMDLAEITIAEALQSAGYRTALFGKWHLGAAATHGPTKQGFDEFFGLRGGFIDNYNHFFLHGKGYHDLYRGTEEQFAEGKYFPDMVVREAQRFLQENHKTPFFLYVAFNVPHYPEQSDQKFQDRYQELPMPRQSYARMISTTDDRIGQVMSKLDELGIRDDTIIVFLSDNGHSAEHNEIKVDDHNSGLAKGTYYGAHGGGGNTGKWRGNKGTFYEGGIRVPAMISFPTRLPQGQVRDQAITAADFFPTVLELCDVSLPDVTLDGQSLLPIIKSPQAPSHHEVMHWQWNKRWAVREGDWKLISTGKKMFLGNLADEKPEEKNHADEQPDVVQRLQELHEAWEAEVRSNEQATEKTK
jgi:arylsulfatase A